MSVASLDLCKELYEVSGWDDKDLWHDEMYISGALGPYYDLGYLLRKLPDNWVIEKDERFLIDGQPRHDIGPFYATWYDMREGRSIKQRAYTPEDATAKLAIELFKQGVLKRGDQVAA